MSTTHHADHQFRSPLDDLSQQVTTDFARDLSTAITRDLSQNPENALALMRAISTSKDMPAGFASADDLFGTNDDFCDHRKKDSSPFDFGDRIRDDLSDFGDRIKDDLFGNRDDGRWGPYSHDIFDSISRPKMFQRDEENAQVNYDGQRNDPISRIVNLVADRIEDDVDNVGNHFNKKLKGGDDDDGGDPISRLVNLVADRIGDDVNNVGDHVNNAVNNVGDHLNRRQDDGDDDDGDGGGGGGFWKTAGSVAMKVIPFLL